MKTFAFIAFALAPVVVYVLLKRLFGYRMRAARDVVYEMLTDDWESTKSFMGRVLNSDNVTIKNYINSYSYKAVHYARTHHSTKKVESKQKAAISFLLYQLLLAEKVDMEIKGVSKGYILQAFEESKGDTVAEQFLTKLASATKESKEYIRKKQIKSNKKFVPTLDLSL